DLVEGGRAHGDERRRAAEDVHDARPELDALRVDGDLREEAEDLVAPHFGEPEGVVTEAIGEDRGLQVRLAIVLPPEGQDAGGLFHHSLRSYKPRWVLHRVRNNVGGRAGEQALSGCC